MLGGPFDLCDASHMSLIAFNYVLGPLETKSGGVFRVPVEGRKFCP